MKRYYDKLEEITKGKRWALLVRYFENTTLEELIQTN